MDPHLTDLDALLLKVRTRRSRDYIAEAIVAYRVGAYKAAVVATWIAVSFDILAKIRELSQSGDPAALSFTQDFARAVDNDNRDRLLKLEGQLLANALDPFAFIGPQEHRYLSRIKEDRNLCAHPSFSSEAELFQPLPELVRLHIVTAIETLLSIEPVQGRALISVFVDDVPSPSFPRQREQAIRYVAERYVARLRTSALDNFSNVLLKGFLRRDVASWKGHEPSILHALAAIASHRPQVWTNDVRDIALRLIDGASGEQLGRVFTLLKEFPDILERLNPAMRIRLEAFIEGHDFNSATEDSIFVAIDLDAFSRHILDAYTRLDASRRARVLSQFPSRAFLPMSLRALREAKSFRRAEAIFQGAVTPLAVVVTTEDLGDIATAIESNYEAWDASMIPSYVADFVDRVPLHIRFEKAPWAALQTYLTEQDRSDKFDIVWAALSRRGVSLTSA